MKLHSALRRLSGLRRRYFTIRAWGSNDDGRLGLRLPHKYSSLPSWFPAWILDDSVLTSYTARKLPDYPISGDDDLSAQVAGPSPANITEDVVDIVCGMAHTIFLTRSGRVYTCGSNRFGQLGLGKVSNFAFFEPQLVASLLHSRIVCAAAGATHSLFVTESGHVYATGSSGYGQLGLGKAPSNALLWSPQLIDAFDDNVQISKVAAGFQFSIAFDQDNGHVYSFGSRAHGCLGHDSGYSNAATARHDPIEWLPRRIRSLDEKKIDDVYAGASNAVAISRETKAVYSWGAGVNYFHAHDDNREIDKAEPSVLAELSGQEIVKVQSSGTHHGALTSDGRLFLWGLSLSGCLATSSFSATKKPVEITELPRVNDFTLGHQFTIAATAEGVLSWGSGQDGALGNGDDRSHSTPVQVKTQESDEGFNAKHVVSGFAHVFALNADK